MKVRDLQADIIDEPNTNGDLRQSMVITITVYDHADTPVEGATVKGSFYHGMKTASCVTDSAGKCSIKSKSLRGRINDIAFNVQGISLPFHRYDKKENIHSSIQVTKSASGFHTTKSKTIPKMYKKKSNLWALSKVLKKLKAFEQSAQKLVL